MVVEPGRPGSFRLVPDRLIERQRLAAHLHRPRGIGDGQAGGMAIPRWWGSRPWPVDEAALDVADLAIFFDHVHGNADRAALIGDGAADRPGGIHQVA